VPIRGDLHLRLVLPAQVQRCAIPYFITAFEAMACGNTIADAIPAASTTFHKRTSIYLPFSGSQLRPTPITPRNQAHRHLATACSQAPLSLRSAARTALRASFRPIARVAARRASRLLLVPRDVNAARSSARCRCVAWLIRCHRSRILWKSELKYGVITVASQGQEPEREISLSCSNSSPHREGQKEGGAWGRPPRPSAILALTERDGQHCQVGNNMGTALATSAQCHHNERASGQFRNFPAITAFKYHRNVSPIPRVWQTRRTQNPQRRHAGSTQHSPSPPPLWRHPARVGLSDYGRSVTGIARSRGPLLCNEPSPMKTSASNIVAR